MHSGKTLNSRQIGTVGHSTGKSEDCHNGPCEMKWTSARGEVITLRGIIHRTEWLSMVESLRYGGKRWIEDKTYVSNSSYYIYVIPIKCVCVYSKDEFHFEQVDIKHLWDSDGNVQWEVGYINVELYKIYLGWKCKLVRHYIVGINWKFWIKLFRDNVYSEK